VPSTAIATTTERTFVVRIRNGQVEWVDVKRGATMKQLVEVFGGLAEGDQVAIRGTDELKPGTVVQVKLAPPNQ
jgi:membrane fusion protein (multidrug efflux system)